MFGQLLELEVRPFPRLMGFHLQQQETLAAYLPDEVLTVADNMIGRETVAIPALRMAVVLVKAGAHVCARMEMTAVGLLYRLDLPAGDTPERTAGHRVPQTDIPRENGVEPVNER